VREGAAVVLTDIDAGASESLASASWRRGRPGSVSSARRGRRDLLEGGRRGGIGAFRQAPYLVNTRRTIAARAIADTTVNAWEPARSRSI